MILGDSMCRQKGEVSKTGTVQKINGFLVKNRVGLMTWGFLHGWISSPCSTVDTMDPVNYAVSLGIFVASLWHKRGRLTCCFECYQNLDFLMQWVIDCIRDSFWRSLSMIVEAESKYPSGKLTWQWKIHHFESMYFLSKVGIFQPAMLVSGRVTSWKTTNSCHFWGKTPPEIGITQVASPATISRCGMAWESQIWARQGLWLASSWTLLVDFSEGGREREREKQMGTIWETYHF